MLDKLITGIEVQATDTLVLSQIGRVHLLLFVILDIFFNHFLGFYYLIFYELTSYIHCSQMFIKVDKRKVCCRFICNTSVNLSFFWFASFTDALHLHNDAADSSIKGGGGCSSANEVLLSPVTKLVCSATAEAAPRCLCMSRKPFSIRHLLHQCR